MAARTINIERYLTPGSGSTQEVSIHFTLLDSAGRKVDGYRTSDDTGIVGTRVITLTDSATSIDLMPNTEIYPSDTQWNIKVCFDGVTMTNTTVQFDAGAAMTFPELLQATLP